MPLISGKDKIGKYYKWGSEGKKYYYSNPQQEEIAKKRAIKQALAISYNKKERIRRGKEAIMLESALRRNFNEEQRRYQQEQYQKNKEKLRELEQQQQRELARLQQEQQQGLAELHERIPEREKISEQEQEITELQKQLEREKIEREVEKGTVVPPEDVRKAEETRKKAFEKNVEFIKDVFETDDEARRHFLSKFGIKSARTFDEAYNIAKGDVRKKREFDNLVSELNKTHKLGKETLRDRVKSRSRFMKIVGSGKSLNRNSENGNILYNDQIEEYLKPLKKHGFLGVIMADEVNDFYDNELQKRGSFIMNLDTSDKDGSHWVAVYWDLRNHHDGHYIVTFKQHHQTQGLYYYDPFGREPSDEFLREIKLLMDRIKNKFEIDYEIYFQYNECQQQNKLSYECGFFCMLWLIKMYDGFNPNEKCCHMHDVRKSEKEIKPFIKEFHKEQHSVSK